MVGIKGVGFGTEDISVDIDGVPCDVSEIAEDMIYCVTRKSAGVSNSGYYLVSEKYMYEIDWE